MKLNYNESGNRRKALVKVISDTIGEKAVYKFTPTYNFEIGIYTVTRYGELLFPDGTDATEVIEALRAAGFEHDPVETAPSETEDEGHEEAKETTETDASADGLTIEIPRDFFTEAALDNLQKLIDSKATLIKKALGADALPVQVTDEKVSFP